MARQAGRNHAAEYQEKPREPEERHRRTQEWPWVQARQLARKLQTSIPEQEARR